MFAQCDLREHYLFVHLVVKRNPVRVKDNLAIEVPYHVVISIGRTVLSH